LGEELTVGIAVGRFESSALRVAFETSEFLLLVLSAITGVGVVLAIVVVVCSGVRSRRALAARPTFAFGSGVVDGGGNRRENFTGFIEPPDDRGTSQERSRGDRVCRECGER
jgi:hypothetical protein